MNALFRFLDAVAFHRRPLHTALLRRLMREIPIAPYSYRASIDAVVRPQYAYCIIEAARLAKNLGLGKFSIIEFGVAGGNGLVNIEGHVEEVRKEFGIDCEVYGFDGGEGMPPSNDYRDVLYFWDQGYYRMDREKLERRLEFAKLVIGDVKETCAEFYEKYDPAPLGCVFFDLDYYTSTLPAFEIFNTKPENRLPRIPCHFDDISCTNEFIGELCAIKEFNETHAMTKIAPEHLMSETRKIPMPWNHEIFVFHDFGHPHYNTCFRGDRQLPIEG